MDAYLSVNFWYGADRSVFLHLSNMGSIHPLPSWPTHFQVSFPAVFRQMHPTSRKSLLAGKQVQASLTSQADVLT